MNRKKRGALLLCAALLAPWTAPAQTDDYAPYLNPPTEAAPSPVLEAGQAIFGRVFGVQGSGAEIDYHVFDVSSRTPAHAAIRSALVPGWGQVFNKDKVKGILFFVTTAATAIGSAVVYHDAKDSYQDYKAQGIQNSSLYDDYEDERTQAMVLGVAALVFYTVGIVDAYRHAYRPLYTSEGALNLTLAPTEGQVVWQKKF